MTYNLKIGWLYPELMNIYGDRGNVITLVKRCEWRGIKTSVEYLDLGFDHNKLALCDLLLMGGAQDKQQEAVSADLFKKKDSLKQAIEKGIPGLYICGAYQFLGNYYKDADAKIIKGLSVFDLYTQNPGEKHKRLIGNSAFQINNLEPEVNDYVMIGFENHGGRTYLGKNTKPFGYLMKGFGNNGKDKTEGAHYKNSFGTYLHGPILPKNPDFADFLIKKALEIKYKKQIELAQIENSFEKKARLAIAKRLSIAI